MNLLRYRLASYGQAQHCSTNAARRATYVCPPRIIANCRRYCRHGLYNVDGRSLDHAILHPSAAIHEPAFSSRFWISVAAYTALWQLAGELIASSGVRNFPSAPYAVPDANLRL